MTASFPDVSRPLRIGTRGSALALAQAHETRDRLIAAHGLAEDAFRIVVIKTTGDRITDRPLKDIGGKGLFTREIEDALLDGEIDLAVHSMKDMPVLQPDGLAIDCYLPREDPRDAFVSRRYGSIAEMPAGARVGSSSLRRRAQLIHARPDLEVVEFRGNVQTRLRKLDDGVADATFLAMAGLSRLGMTGIARPIEVGEMLPAIAQGAIGIERRADDAIAGALVAAVADLPTALRVGAERAFLARLDGSCDTPIAGLAQLGGDGTLRLCGQILLPDGSLCLSGEREGRAGDGPAMGIDLADDLLHRAPPAFFELTGIRADRGSPPTV